MAAPLLAGLMVAWGPVALVALIAVLVALLVERLRRRGTG